MTTESDKKLRAVSYCRTSSEGQRDNTSIPRQKADNERFIGSQDWEFVGHYVDESLTGAKIEGREEFQRMMRDAAKGEFDVIVCWDVTRFARDGCDIITNAKFLKTNFGVYVVDTKGQFDSRDHRRTLTNFVQAGVAEDEKLRILERCIGGRIRRAQEGMPWGSKRPAGRDFKSTGKHSGTWYVTEEGERLRELLERYANGESLKALVREYGGISSQAITRNVRESQLAGEYHAKFHAPDIGIKNLRIAVPGVPPVITPELEQRVKARMAHNQKWNKQEKQKYLLGGFVTCAHCGRPLYGQTNMSDYVYYRHVYQYGEKRNCPYYSIPTDLLDGHVLDYLYSFFLDEPAYNEAIKATLPSDNDRKALGKDIKAAEKRLTAADKEIQNLVNAIAAGADVGLLLDKQNQLKAEKQVLETRLDDLRQTFAAMPSRERLETDAMLLRLRLVQEYKGRDWRKLPYEEVRRFLHFLFGDNPKAKGYGIFVECKGDAWHITFKGCVEFYHDVVNGRPIYHALQVAAEAANAEIRSTLKVGIELADLEYEQAMKRLERSRGVVKPDNDLFVARTYKRPCQTVDPKVEGSRPFGLVL
jgi:site-specific DNA recombinase